VALKGSTATLRVYQSMPRCYYRPLLCDSQRHAIGLQLLEDHNE